MNGDIYVDELIAFIAKDVTRKANSITSRLIRNIRQTNNHRFHIISNQANIQKVQEFMDKYLDETVDELEKETKKCSRITIISQYDLGDVFFYLLQ